MSELNTSTSTAACSITATRRSLYFTSLACSIVLLAIMAAPILFGHVYVADDLGEFHLPSRAFYHQCLSLGQPFDWWPHLYGGVYLTGEGQAGTYHPLHLALYQAFPLSLAFGLEVWLSYPFMLVGTLLWLRRRLVRPEIAMFGALLFTFCGFNLLHFVHVNAIAIVAHIPWLLWAIDRVLTDDRKKLAGPVLIIALLTGSQLLLGYPQYVWFSLIAEIGYVACRFRADRVALIVAAKLVGLLIGAIQWLPTLDALNNSVRQTADSQFAVSGSLHPLNLLQLIAPYLFENRVVGQNTHELGLYIGAVPVMLVAWLLLRGQTSRRQRRICCFAGSLGLLATLMALGSHGVIYRLQTYLPVVGKFRFPCRMIVLMHLALAVLAAIALDALLRRRSTERDGSCSSVYPLWWIVAAATLLAATAPLLWPGHIAAWPLVVAGPAVLGIATWLIRRAECGARWALLGLVILTAVDQGIYGLGYAAVTQTAPLGQYAQQADGQPDGPAGRRVALDIDEPYRNRPQWGNRILLAGWHRVGGYAGLPPQRTLDYRQPNALRVAGVHFEAQPEPTDAGGVQFRPVANPVAEARLITRTVWSTDPAGDIERIDVQTTALVDSPLELSPGRPGHVTTVKRGAGRLSLITETTSPQLLVVAQSYHDGWQATVDGFPVPIRRVYGDFLGCVVPAGRHHVAMAFWPDSLKKGLTLSWCGVGLMLCGFLATRYGHRPR